MATPACPRCGYDLSGAVAVWEDTCPLTGICSECGLELEWRRVLNPALTTPKWSFEHAINRRIRRMLTTCAVAILPWSFWRQLRMEHPIRPRRLLTFAAVLLLGAHLACTLAQGWETYSMATYSMRQGARFGIVPDEKPWVSAIFAGLWPYRTYSINWAGYNVAPYLGMFLVALCLLLGAPLAMLLLPDTFKLARVRRLHILRGALYGLTVPTMAAIIVVAIIGGTTSMRLLAFGGPLPWASFTVAGVVFAAIVWYPLWWWFFTRRYLQLPSAWLVAIIILVIAALLAATVAIKIAVAEAQRFN